MAPTTISGSADNWLTTLLFRPSRKTQRKQLDRDLGGGLNLETAISLEALCKQPLAQSAKQDEYIPLIVVDYGNGKVTEREIPPSYPHPNEDTAQLPRYEQFLSPIRSEERLRQLVERIGSLYHHIPINYHKNSYLLGRNINLNATSVLEGSLIVEVETADDPHHRILQFYAQFETQSHGQPANHEKWLFFTIPEGEYRSWHLPRRINDQQDRASALEYALKTIKDLWPDIHVYRRTPSGLQTLTKVLSHSTTSPSLPHPLNS